LSPSRALTKTYQGVAAAQDAKGLARRRHGRRYRAKVGVVASQGCVAVALPAAAGALRPRFFGDMHTSYGTVLLPSSLIVMEEHPDTPKLKAQRDAEHWRKCAADAREVARMIGLADARHRMEVMAEEYDRLAEQADRRAGLS